MGSKTAEKKQVAAPKQKVELNPVEVISTIRSNMAARIFVNNMDYIRVLLAQYDAAIAENANLTDGINLKQDILDSLTADHDEARKLLTGKQQVLDIVNFELSARTDELLQSQQDAANLLRDLKESKLHISCLTAELEAIRKIVSAEETVFINGPLSGQILPLPQDKESALAAIAADAVPHS